VETEAETPDRDLVLYRLEVGGRIPASWVGWFEADTITTVEGLTTLDVRVADQAELYGRLRRIHDLNLRLISVTRIGAEDRAPGQNDQ
jgi:hypothetical protein